MAKFSINLKTGSIDKGDAPQRSAIIGIDLGTTNSLVAYIKDGKPVCIKREGGRHALVPSVVHLGKERRVTVGDSAKDFLLSEPERTVFSVKRLMGKSYKDISDFESFFSYKVIDEDDERLVKVRIDDVFYTPVELSAMILRELKTIAEQHLQQVVDKAVITVPAYFNDAQRQATRDAGKLAGLDVLRIVNEPTAAALAYDMGVHAGDSRTVAVYDLGGGTFDVSILRIEDGVFEVLATNGDTFLGGDDFDRAILTYWQRKYDVSGDAQALRLKAEEAKKQLSTTEDFSCEFEGKTLTISAEEFKKISSELINKTIECCRNALTDAGLNVSDIDEVVMVGGSTRMALVKAAVASFFENRHINDKVNPDEVVALGAAVQADILAGNNKEVLLLDITPLSLGIETVGGLMDVIIPRNSKVPSAMGRHYTTSIDGQTALKVAVYQGERDLVKDNRKLGEFIVRGIPPMPAGLPKIDIQFVLNADGILLVKAHELRSGVEQSVEMRSIYGISQEDMAKMLLDSIHNAQSDMSRRALIEARTEAQTVVLAADKFMAQHGALLSESESQETLALLAALRLSIEGEDKDLIQKSMDDLNTFTAPLAHRAMDYTIAQAMQGKTIDSQ